MTNGSQSFIVVVELEILSLSCGVGGGVCVMRCGLTAARSDHVALQSLSTVRTQQLTELFVDLSIAPPQEAKQGMR